MSAAKVCVVYATPERQVAREVSVREGARLEEAIASSGLLEEFPEIDLARNRVGIFGRIASRDTRLKSGDQVEIYRALQADPKDARRRRARSRA